MNIGLTLKNENMEEIKAGDIMIGDYFEIDRGIGVVEQICTANYADWNDSSDYQVNITVNGVYYVCTLNELIPIPLSEDILLKAGATKIGEKLYKFRHAFIIHENSSCFVIRMESEEGRFWNVMPFSYLHQLQNIYRLCMNQDLKVDL